MNALNDRFAWRNGKLVISVLCPKVERVKFPRQRRMRALERENVGQVSLVKHVGREAHRSPSCPCDMFSRLVPYFRRRQTLLLTL